jgi:hypothetical protein
MQLAISSLLSSRQDQIYRLFRPLKALQAACKFLALHAVWALPNLLHHLLQAAGTESVDGKSACSPSLLKL